MKKHGNKKQSQTITLSKKELAEFGKHYADEVEVEKICFQLKNFDFDDTDEKKTFLGL